jgi:1-deoxy-D-xylulose-5-phosphate reductoisomerase
MDWTRPATWTFEPADRDTFRALDLAEQAGRAGGVAPAVLNAANEVAVDAFLGGALGFLDIAAVVAATLDEHEDAVGGVVDHVDHVLTADGWARRRAATLVTAAPVAAVPATVTGTTATPVGVEPQDRTQEAP